MPEYLGKHTLRPHQHIIVPEPQNAIPGAPEDFRSSKIVFACVGMLPTVQLNDQPSLDASEIGDVARDRMLTAEAETV